MTRAALTVILLAQCSFFCRGDETRPPSLLQEGFAKLKSAFPYQPPQPEPAPSVADSPAVVMPRVTVRVRAFDARALNEKMQVDEDEARAEKFSFTNGGTLLKASLGGALLEIGGWGTAGGINFFRLSW